MHFTFSELQSKQKDLEIFLLARLGAPQPFISPSGAASRYSHWKFISIDIQPVEKRTFVHLVPHGAIAHAKIIYALKTEEVRTETDEVGAILFSTDTTPSDPWSRISYSFYIYSNLATSRSDNHCVVLGVNAVLRDFVL
jgi:hypothetical protein